MQAQIDLVRSSSPCPAPMHSTPVELHRCRSLRDALLSLCVLLTVFRLIAPSVCQMIAQVHRIRIPISTPVAATYIILVVPVRLLRTHLCRSRELKSRSRVERGGVARSGRTRGG